MILLRASLLAALLGALVVPAWAQGQIFRCGNEYMNDAHQAQLRGCQVVETGPVAVVPGTQVLRTDRSRNLVQTSVARPPERAVREAAAEPAVGARTEQRVDAAQQRARDTDARFILESELRKAEAQLARLQAEFNNGEPEKQGIEGRNHQRYLDRVQSMREAIVRQQSDITSLKRELARLPGSSTVASTP